jgi:hypothetical protein
MFNFFKSKKKQEITDEGEFADIYFIADSIASEDGKTVIRAKLPSRDIGIEIIVQDTTSSFLVDENSNPKYSVTPQGVVFRSLGEMSDAFLEFLSSEYKLPVQNVKMVKEIAFTSLALEGDPAQIVNQPVKFKLFFEKEFTDPESKEADSFYENEYFEVFLNIDLKNRKLSLDEKDIEYRKPLLKSLIA